MLIRKIFFWLHLGAGSLAGAVIVLMCLTGAALGFEKQLVRWAERKERTVTAKPESERLPLESLLREMPAESGVPTTVTWHRAPDTAVELGLGRDRVIFLDPYTGAKLGEGHRRLRAFFGGAESLHRWLGAEGPARPTARAITGAANLAFLFLASSGLYLWRPRSWTWTAVRRATTFRGGLSGRARDFNWHNAIGFWACLPLIVMLTCSTAMSYPWANNLVYRLSGSPIPTSSPGTRAGERAVEREPPELAGFDRSCVAAEKKVAAWRTIRLRMPFGKSPNLTFQIDAGDGGRPDKHFQLTLDRRTGRELSWESFASHSRGRQIRAWMRFAHTGEAGGAAGQSLASAAALGGVFLAYTGISMAIRRYRAWRSRAKAPVV
jgi:uncharacterized iron-regulated membrane protein